MSEHSCRVKSTGKCAFGGKGGAGGGGKDGPAGGGRAGGGGGSAGCESPPAGKVAAPSPPALEKLGTGRFSLRGGGHERCAKLCAKEPGERGGEGGREGGGRGGRSQEEELEMEEVLLAGSSPSSPF